MTTNPPSYSDLLVSDTDGDGYADLAVADTDGDGYADLAVTSTYEPDFVGYEDELPDNEDFMEEMEDDADGGLFGFLGGLFEED